MKFLSLSNGIPKLFDESGSIPIYDVSLLVVDSSPSAGEILGPITAGDDITLPDGQTYVGEELQVFLNGIRLEQIRDYTYVSSTQIDFTFELVPTDIIRFYIDRSN
jgi:hypothetical protein